MSGYSNSGVYAKFIVLRYNGNAMRKILFPALCIITLLVSGCALFRHNSSSSSSSSQTTSSSSSSTSSSKLDPELTLSASLVKVKVDHQVTITATAKNGTGMVTWTSNDTSIATVSNGTITGKKVGTTYVTARYSGVTARCDVDVEPNVIINLNKSSIELNVGDSDTITATFSGGSGDVSWTSNNTGVATVTKTSATTASISGIASGNAIITANYSGVVKSCSVHVSNGGSRPTSGTTTIEIYASNDVHGAIDEEVVDSDQRLGVAKWGTYFKQQGDKDNTLLIDQGDTWQGTIYSNDNRGALITDVMNYIHYDARTVGNHDFDWGVDALKANTARSYAGYATPVLAGNVYDYNFDSKITGTTQQSSIGGKSVYYDLENGLRVGILGCIGSDQITSISTEKVKDIAFTDHISFIKSEATHLRNDLNCDVVIASIHAGVQGSSLNTYGLNDYIDLLLAAHTHWTENQTEGNVHYVQFGENTERFGHVTLTFNYSTNTVTDTTVQVLYANTLKSQVTSIDPTIQSIINNYKNNCSEDADEIMASNVSGTFEKDGELPNLMAEAILDQCNKEGFNVTVAMVNDARAEISTSSWTYQEVFTSFPFDNEIYIMTVKGTELKNELNYSSTHICRRASFIGQTVNTNADSFYTIACIDYMATHVNSSRNYNYFPYGATHINSIMSKTYRYILKDYMRANFKSGATLSASNYSGSQERFAKN